MQRIMDKAENGEWGDAIFLISKHLDGKGPSETREILQDFVGGCLERGYEPPQVFDMLSCLDLSMDLKIQIQAAAMRTQRLELIDTR